MPKRSKIFIAICADRRWLLPEELNRPDIDRKFALGLHMPGTFHKVIDTRACLLQPDLGNVLFNDVREFMRASDLPGDGSGSDQANLLTYHRFGVETPPKIALEVQFWG